MAKKFTVTIYYMNGGSSIITGELAENASIEDLRKEVNRALDAAKKNNTMMRWSSYSINPANVNVIEVK